MKKTLFTFMALAMAFAVTSCQSEEKLPLEELPQEPTNELMGTTGTAKATIDGKQVDVKWVQLWADGPKFAEFNVGAENKKAEDYGGYYCWGTGDSDTATALWGSNWRMPTKAELEALINNCEVTWTYNYNSTDKNGRIYTGKGAYSSNSVFLPAAGRDDDYFDDRGNYGCYWSSTPDGNYLAYALRFNSGGKYMDNYDRLYGYSVRAVLAK